VLLRYINTITNNKIIKNLLFKVFSTYSWTIPSQMIVKRCWTPSTISASSKSADMVTSTCKKSPTIMEAITSASHLVVKEPLRLASAIIAEILA
jgi:hypothetical protein